MTTPILSNYFPKEADAGVAQVVQLLGANFDLDAKVYQDNVEVAATWISANAMTVSLPASTPFGRYLFRIENPDDENPDRLEVSGEVELRLHARRQDAPLPDYPETIVDPRIQPLPPPLTTRRDPQRIGAGDQFDGSLPDDAQGVFKDGGAAPTTGGVWRWAEKVLVTQLEFRSDGPEPGAGRTAGSGFYKRYADGTEIYLVNLSNTPIASNGTAEYYFASDTAIELEQGEELVLRTFGATKEMIATPKIRIDRPYL